MISKEDFIKLVLDGPVYVDSPPAKAGILARPQKTRVTDDTPFGQLVLGGIFGAGKQKGFQELIKGEQKTAVFLPDEITHWQRDTTRDFDTLLIEITHSGRSVASGKPKSGDADWTSFLRKKDELEDILQRAIQDVLVGFSSGPRTSQEGRGEQEATLCVLSIRDDRRSESSNHLLLFGTKYGESLAFFEVREEAREWAKTDRALAEEHLEKVFHRHLLPLVSGGNWQRAFISEREEKLVAHLEAVAKGNDDADILHCTEQLLEQIAESFGIRAVNQGGVRRRLRTKDLPPDHTVGASPKATSKKGFQNPLKGMRVYDHSLTGEKRLLGFVVYAAKNRAEGKQLETTLRAHNHFHNVLVIVTDDTDPEVQLWQGTTQTKGRMIMGPNRPRFAGPVGMVQLLSRFFVITRSRINTPEELAMELAIRAQHLRELCLESLETQLKNEHGTLKELFDTFNANLAQMSPKKFADTYAQTVTYGMLAARWMSREQAQSILFSREKLPELLPSTSPFLRVLFSDLVRNDFDQNIEWVLEDIASLLARTIVSTVFEGKSDPAIHFYEKFLDVYDPNIKKEMGVYYTPDEVVTYMVESVHRSLIDDFGLRLGLADSEPWDVFAARQGLSIPEGIKGSEPFVQILDPATGTGTFLLRILQVVRRTMLEEFRAKGQDEEQAWISYVRNHLLPRLNAFELMMAPYIVCHLRLGLFLKDTGFEFEEGDRLNVFLTNTLEWHSDDQTNLVGEHIAKEGDAADDVKLNRPISVIIGNPPYKVKRKKNHTSNSEAEQTGGWVTAGDTRWQAGRPIFADFLNPLKEANKAGHAKVIYELSIYFLRWSIWRVYERWNSPGIVSLITPSAYLKGNGSSGVREVMRRTADQLYILDLEGDQRGSRKTDNIFVVVQTPVCIGTMMRNSVQGASAANTSYLRVSGTRHEKLATCLGLATTARTNWRIAPTEWQSVFIPGVGTEFEDWPRITEILPWQRSGCMSGRMWPIAHERELLELRWKTLVNSRKEDRPELLKESPSGRSVVARPRGLFSNDQLTAVTNLTGSDEPERIVRYAWRSFDRQWIIADHRLLDRAGPILWTLAGPSQIFLATMISKVLGNGPAATVSGDLPDRDVFSGRGGKDIIPLWRDADQRVPNVSSTLIAKLCEDLGAEISPVDVFAYVYAILANPGYFDRFREELRVPGPRIPLTKDVSILQRGATLGYDMLRWQTFGTRFKTPEFKLEGSAQLRNAVSKSYPENYRYDAVSQVLKIGELTIEKINPNVWEFNVSGLQVVKSWLDYRMKDGAGNKSSPLDDMRPNVWTKELTQELLEVLWVLEWTVNKYAELDDWLEEVLESPLFEENEIPMPPESMREEPKFETKGALL